MGIYRKKPVEIEAFQWDGSMNNAREITENFGEDFSLNSVVYQKTIDNGVAFLIMTLEGDMRVSPEDYIIKGVNGEFYPCKNDIFEKTYEKVE